MKTNIRNAAWTIGVLLLAGFCLVGCDRRLDVRTVYPFQVTTMPIPKTIAPGEEVEIRCTLAPERIVNGTRYTPSAISSTTAVERCASVDAVNPSRRTIATPSRRGLSASITIHSPPDDSRSKSCSKTTTARVKRSPSTLTARKRKLKVAILCFRIPVGRSPSPLDQKRASESLSRVHRNLFSSPILFITLT